MIGKWKKIRWTDIHSNKLFPLFFTIIFVFLINQYSFNFLESIFYDWRIRFPVGVSAENNVAVVYIDEVSDDFLGENYPYTYASHNRFIEKLIQDRPRSIIYFVNLFTPDSQVEEQAMRGLKKKLMNYNKQSGSFRFGTELNAWGEQLPPEELRSLGHSLGILHVDSHIFAKDDVVRRAILNISGENSVHLWAANQFRVAHGGPWLDANQYFGSYYVEEADATFALFRYFTNPKEGKTNILSIPYHQVLTGNFEPGLLTDKIVLVGPKYLSKSSDYVTTPFDHKDSKGPPKMNVHAEIIQALLQKHTIWQVPKSFIHFLSLLICIFLSLSISRVRPTKGLLIILIALVLTVLVSFLLFFFLNVWVFLSPLIISIFLVYYIWVPFQAMAEYQTRYAFERETKLLKKVDQMKRNFISIMGHDLKTPVAKIAGITENLLYAGKNSEVATKQGLETILQSTKELNHFILSILELTKVESQDIHLHYTSKDVNKVVETVVESLRDEQKLAKVLVQLDVAPLYPVTMDVTLMRRVFYNVLGNAYKYSQGTKVVIKTWDDANWVYIEIRDNGVGISEENLKRIFERFFRVKESSTNPIKGSGLGLYLVKYFVELQGGKITVTSELGRGTSFLIRLRNA